MADVLFRINSNDLRALREIIIHAGIYSTERELRKMGVIKILTSLDTLLRFKKQISKVSGNRGYSVSFSSLADPKFRQELFAEYRLLTTGTDKVEEELEEASDRCEATT